MKRLALTWWWIRYGADEIRTRRYIGMAPGHPERVAGSDEAAITDDFIAWTAEMDADGRSAGEIILAVRREEEQ